jgi:WD40 repeat protein
MLRFIVVLLLAVSIAGGVAYSTGWLDSYLTEGTGGSGQTLSSQEKAKFDYGEPLYPAIALSPLPAEEVRKYSLLVIDPCHASSRYTQEVSSPREGQLLYVGKEVKEKSTTDDDQQRQLKVFHLFDGFETRSIKVRPFEMGDIVEYDQIVAVLNSAIAAREVEKQRVKLEASIGDHKATRDLVQQATERYEKYRELAPQRLVSVFDLAEAKMAVAKYTADEIMKQGGVGTSREELAQALVNLDQYYLKSKLTGKAVIKRIDKRDSEGVKPQETVMELHDISNLKVEGTVDSQHVQTLLHNKNAKCYLEPSVELGNVEFDRAHRSEVTCVAVCADGEHFVSGSADHDVYVWQRGRESPVGPALRHKSGVRTVACSPKGAWLVVGCDDGSLSLWDLTQAKQAKEPVKRFAEVHRGPVTALAFSPDGTYIASGGEDNTIILWKTATGEVVYPFDFDHGVDDPHQGRITSLHFTPQCKLVSAGLDNKLRVWSLFQKGAELERGAVPYRDGTVNHLGVSADGRFMLFDKGRTLQLFDVAEQSPVCSMENLGLNPFDTLALFSPDGSLMLTGGAGEGKLRLWKTPSHKERAYQVRELVTTDRTAITSAAFAPADKRFAVTGSKGGNVHLWPLPDKSSMDKHRIFKDAKGHDLELTLPDPSLDAGKTRVIVNVFLNPEDRLLLPGQRATVVVVLPREAQ